MWQRSKQTLSSINKPDGLTSTAKESMHHCSSVLAYGSPSASLQREFLLQRLKFCHASVIPSFLSVLTIYVKITGLSQLVDFSRGSREVRTLQKRFSCLLLSSWTFSTSCWHATAASCTRTLREPRSTHYGRFCLLTPNDRAGNNSS